MKSVHSSKIEKGLISEQGPYSPTILKNVLKSCSPDFFQYLAAFECNTTSDWLNHMV